MKMLARLLKDCRGVSAIEYAMLAAFIALTLFASFGNVGDGVSDRFEKAEKSFPDSGGNGKGKGKGKDKDKA